MCHQSKWLSRSFCRLLTRQSFVEPTVVSLSRSVVLIRSLGPNVMSGSSHGGPGPAKRAKVGSEGEDDGFEGKDVSPASGKFRGRQKTDNLCAICQESILASDKAILFPCLHDFHKDCIDTWTQSRNTCPECRQVAAQVRWNVRSESEFESREVPVPPEEPSLSLRIAMASMSPSTFAVYIFPIPAIELVTTSRPVTLIHRREENGEEQTVAQIAARSQHIFSIAELLDSEHLIVRDSGHDYPVDQTIDGLILQQVLNSAADLGIQLPEHLANDDESGSSGRSSSSNGSASEEDDAAGSAARRPVVTRGQITSGQSEDATTSTGRGLPFPFLRRLFRRPSDTSAPPSQTPPSSQPPAPSSTQNRQVRRPDPPSTSSSSSQAQSSRVSRPPHQSPTDKRTDGRRGPSDKK